jgi:hypothetical protein
VLAANIDLAGGIAANQHHREAGDQPVLTLDARDLVSDAAAKLGGDDFSIDDGCGHAVLMGIVQPWAR